MSMAVGILVAQTDCIFWLHCGGSATDTFQAPAMANDTKEMFIAFAKVSKVYGDGDQRTAESMGEGLKAFLREGAAALLKRNRRRPILFTYSSDATPMLCQSVLVTPDGEGGTFRKHGKVLHELLLQRGSLMAIASEEQVEVAHLVAEPLPLSKGKGAWQHYTAACAFFDLPRAQGHEGICVCHVSFDRGVYQPLLRFLSGRMELFYDKKSASHLGVERKLLRLTDWLIGTPCACHDTHNSLRHAVDEHVDRQLLKDVHVVTASLRNGHQLLVERVGTFLAKHIARTTKPPNTDIAILYWRVLGVDASWVERIALLDPSWEPLTEKLYVQGRDLTDEKLLTETATVILRLLGTKRFSDSRWCGMAPCSRSLLASVEAGIDKLVGITLADDTAVGREKHLRGYMKFTPAARTFATVCSIAGFVTDTLLYELMEDDRVGLRVVALKEILAEEVSWVESLPLPVWERLADALPDEYDGERLRDACVRATHTAGSYITASYLAPAEKYPWRLARGDIDANLQELKDRPDGATGLDETTTKIYKLVKKGMVSRGALIAAIQLMLEIHWSTTAVEQAHGSAAVVHRFHPEYAGQTLALRSLIHMVRHFFFPPSTEKTMLQIDKQLRQLERKNPHKASGRQMFLKRVFMGVKKRKAAAKKKITQSVSRYVMKQCEQRYQALSAGERVYYDRVAREYAEQAVTAIGESRKYLIARRALAVERSSKEMESRPKNRLSNTRLNEEELLRLGHHVRAFLESPRLLAKRRSVTWVAPDKPLPAEQKIIEGLATQGLLSKGRAPLPWVRALANGRDLLRGAIITAPHIPGGEHLFAVCYILKSPMGAYLLRLQETDNRTALRLEDDGEDAIDAGLRYAPSVFTYTQGDYCTEAAFPVCEISDVFIFEEARYGPATILKAYLEPAQLDEYARRHGIAFSVASEKKQGGHAQAKKKGLSKKQSAYLEKRPSLLALMGPDTQEPGKASGSSSTDTPFAAGKLVPAPVLDEDDEGYDSVDETFKDLAENRLWWAVEDSNVSLYFYKLVRGGRWTKKKKGVAFDCVAGFARAGLARYWARQYGLPRMASYSVHPKTGHTEANAHVFAEEWCRKMHYFMEIYLDSKQKMYTYTEEDRDNYIPSETFIDVYLSLDSLHRSADRCSELYNLFPKKPVVPVLQKKTKAGGEKASCSGGPVKKKKVCAA